MVVSKEITHLDHSQVKLSINVPQTEVKNQYDDLLNYYVKNIQLPGFRKGKAPQDVIERKLGESLKADALGKILEEATKTVLEQEDFPQEARPLPYSSPTVQETPQFSLDSDLSFSVVYDVFPTVQVGTWKGLEIEEPQVEITDEDIQRELEQLRERNAIVIDKMEDSIAAKNDVVTIDYQEVDEQGNPIEGTARQDFVFTIGSGANYFKLDDDIIGMKKGETRIVTRTYPADFEYPELAGTIKHIKVTVTALKEKKLPELDDDFAQDVNEKFKTFADLQEYIKKSLEKNAQNIIRQRKINQILEKLIETSTIDLPESMIRIEQNSRLQSLARQFNTSIDQLLKIIESSGRTYDSLMAEWRPDIEKALKGRLIVDTLIKELQITVNDDEVTQELQSIVENTGANPEEVEKYYEDAQHKQYLVDDIKERKMFDMLFSESKIKKGAKQKYLDLAGENR